MNTTEFGNKIYQLLHSIPERSGKEVKTRSLVLSIIDSMNNMKVLYSGKYGIIVGLNGKQNNKFKIGFRVELDAVELSNNLVMHSCGHDGHMASLLASMLYIDKLNIVNQVISCLFIFQSAEELWNGASKLSKIMSLMGIEVDNLYALHNAPEIYPNQIASREGKILSNNYTTIFRVKLKRIGHFGYKDNVIENIQKFIFYLDQQNKNVQFEYGIIKSDGTLSSLANNYIFSLSIRSFTIDILDLVNLEYEIYNKIVREKNVVSCKVSVINQHRQISNNLDMLERVKSIPNFYFLTAPQSLSSDDFCEYDLISKHQLYFFVGSYLSRENSKLHTNLFKINIDFIKAAIKIYLYLIIGD